MILKESTTTDRVKDLSGVNLLYLAPELFDINAKPDWGADIWSIGQILYLLITGGVDEEEQGDHVERRDFAEPIW